MRVLVCGGRDFDDTYLFYDVLDELKAEGKLDYLISGGARGADTIAERYAEQECIPIDVYPAQWEAYGKAAGYLRNRQMLVEGKPDLVVAFPGGKGTANMVKLAREAGVKVMEIKYYGNSEEDDSKESNGKQDGEDQARSGPINCS